MKRSAPFFLAIAASLLPAIASAQGYSRRVPIVTQVQGAVFYRTSITVWNDQASKTATVTMILSYRSPVDGTFQTKGMQLAPLPPLHAVFFEDIIQTFKQAGIRSQDANAPLFGTLLVKFLGLDHDDDGSVIARTYSPATGGGTNGIAYVGRVLDESGATKIHALVRDGTFGNDGTTRANIGFINEDSPAIDIQIIYTDADTGTRLKAFRLSDVAHHLLEPEEVYQINNVFTDPAVPASTTKVLVEAIPLTTGKFISGYAVQLDATTNDGAFFILAEYD